MAKKVKKSDYIFPKDIQENLSEGTINRYKAKASQGALATYALNKKHGKKTMDQLRANMQNELRNHPDNDGTISAQQNIMEQISKDYSQKNPNFAIPTDSLSNYYSQPQIDLYYQNEEFLGNNPGDNVQGNRSDGSAVGHRNFSSNMINHVSTSKPYLPEFESPGFEEKREYFNHGLDYDINTGQYTPTQKSLGVMANQEMLKGRSEKSFRNDSQGTTVQPQLGFGDWLGRNAGAVGTVAGVGLAAGAVALTGGLAAPLAPAIIGAGATLGNKVGSGIQANHESKVAATDAEQAASYNSKVDFANNQLAMSQQSGDYLGTRENGGYVGIPSSIPKTESLGKYRGQKHSGPDGGIPVDQQGNPSIISGQQPIATVEDNEFEYSDPKTGKSYIFSANDELKFDYYG